MIKLFKKIKRVLHREVIDPFLLLFFASADDAICSVYNSKPVFAESIITNYFQGMLLFGIEEKEKMYWHRKDNLYWQILKQRGIITPESAHLSRRLKSYMKKGLFEIRYNSDFDSVIRACQKRDQTWISEELIDLYKILEKQDYVQTVESYLNGKLVGGFWGIVIGKTYSILSMFHEVDRAGAVALGDLVQRLQAGDFGMIDCGANNDTFKRYGAITVSRDEFIINVINNMNN
jgi:leucyl/phenylalanyl-tRNA--protein transferase